MKPEVEETKKQLHEERPAQQQNPPGSEADMKPQPMAEDIHYKAAGKLEGRVALITGGDSGIGRATAILYAKEGADVAIAYLSEHEDALQTRRMVEKEGRRCITLDGDLGKEEFCKRCVERVIAEFGKLDILVNNAAQQFPKKSIEEITEEQLDRTFRSNIYSYFFLTKAAMPHLKEGATIINTTSVTAYRGSPELLDYSSTKGAIVAFTRSLSLALASKKIRVNGVAPGPIWTPLIPSTFPPEKVKEFGSDTALGRAGQPSEVATCFVFLASDDSSYITGQVLHPNGGEVINT
ncbi:MAG TPA: SDR family oxidoreductase [Planctomycetota bacterium]|nr:SDR family oxidoreductase [Planctomycetota bacterium]